jgi:hypothetical protein
MFSSWVLDAANLSGSHKKPGMVSGSGGCRDTTPKIKVSLRFSGERLD